MRLPQRARHGVHRWATLALLCVASECHAQATSEASLRAKLTLSLSRFAQWPGAPTSAEPLRLCVAQRNAEVARAFTEVDGQLVSGRRVQLQKAPPLAGCHVLYIHASAEQPGELIKAGAAASMLTISDAEGFIAQGGMVELVSVNDAMRFDVNLAALRQAQLGLSSQVLKLARQVRE
jgi:YfiR/HmsC-like